VAEQDFILDPVAGEVQLTERGYAAAERVWNELGRPPIQRPWPLYIENALRAGLLLCRDVDYLVAGNRVQIVDECTGRIHADRSWQDGLHQAVEIKEGLAVTAEKHSLARISRQRFFRLYPSLCGMTGTASGGEREFWELYRLPVVAVPLREPCRRRLLPMRFFADRSAKWEAMLAQLACLHRLGRPIMVGTRNIRQSEQFSQLLAGQGIDHCLLNGKQDRSEAEIVAQAGEVGAVTIATGIAGRGTDIRLSPAAAARGGLHVMGEECQDVGRADRQLAGRSARQGDPGSCQFFVSADDRLVRDHDPALRSRLQQQSDGRGEIHADLAARVAGTQRRIDRQNHLRRRQLMRQDRWLEELVDKLGNPDAR
jgi:preprotein translocase subunit SecA